MNSDDVQPSSSEAPPESVEVQTPIFVSDASAEAERLIHTLRARGYLVIDVPLSLLVARVSVQKPSLILCDADAPGAVDTVSQLRDVRGADSIEVLFIGEPQQVLGERAKQLAHEASGIFARPVDTHALLRKVEALIGPPRSWRPPPADVDSRAPVLVASTRKPVRYESSSGAPRPQRASSSPPSPSLSRPASLSSTSARLAYDEALSTWSKADKAEGSTGPPPPLPAAPAAAGSAHAELSPVIQRLLSEAEARFQSVVYSGEKEPRRLAPNEELDAMLPEDALKALDEALELDEEPASRASAPPAGPKEATARTGMERAEPNTRSERAPPGELPFVESAEPEHAITTPPPRRSSQQAWSTEGARERRSSMPPEIISPQTSWRGSAAPPSIAPSAHPPSARTLEDPHVSAQDSSSRPSEPEHAEPSSSRNSETKDTAEERMPSRLSLPQQDKAQAPDPKAVIQPPSPPESIAPRVSEAAQAPSPDIASPTADPPKSQPDIPTVLGEGDAIRALARLIRARYTGAIAIEDASGIRRAVLRDGDFVTVASGAESETLLHFLVERGDLLPTAAEPLFRKAPPFGRHAGAALIAHGHLKQDELWDVLRSHAEWLLAKIVLVDRGGASLEPDVPVRLRSEPAVFGGATGAEVLVELIRRVIPPETAAHRLGGVEAKLHPGPERELLGECALDTRLTETIEDITGLTLAEGRARAHQVDFPAVAYALRELGILEAFSPSRKAPAPSSAPDNLDDEATRQRIQARRALIEHGDYFAILGVGHEATAYDIERAYQRMRKQFDIGSLLTSRTADLKDDLEVIVDVLDEAYEILKNDLRRERYRRAIEATPL